jgi:hypothetical protein
MKISLMQTANWTTRMGVLIAIIPSKEENTMGI